MQMHYAILAGGCAASAGLFGKLSGLEIFEALLGTFVLGEITSTYWWIGMGCILIGLSLIVSEENGQKEVPNLWTRRSGSPRIISLPHS
ncbi:hypothetical protein HUJ04_011031 [Dendroctonus ponderosae]|nr:hypothetical protein HUJ04_011031 [Dendroctonus ponderosae]KAH1028272.1 hypothetical protein HUJ05_001646 [Dendroctonus ponderosae]